mgnify:CR=1 FL=1
MFVSVDSALAIWKIPGISCLLGLQNPPQFFSLSLVDIWDNFYMHDLQLTIGTICKACESSEGSSIDRNLLVYSSGKVSLNALKATEQIYFSLFRRKSPFKNAWCDAGKGGAEPQAIFSHSTIRVAPHRGLFMGPHTKKNQSIQIWSFFHFIRLSHLNRFWAPLLAQQHRAAFWQEFVRCQFYNLISAIFSKYHV